MPDSYAVHSGRTYRASGRPPGRLALYDGGTEVAEVPIADLDEWYSVRTLATFLGHEFEVLDERDGRYQLCYLAGDGAWAERVWAAPEAHPEVLFQRRDAYTFIAVVPEDRVTDVREVRTDLLTPWREQQEERASDES